MLAIVQCASTSEDQRKVAFSTHAYTIAERALIGRLRKATVFRRRTVRDAGVEITSSNPSQDDEAALFGWGTERTVQRRHLDILDRLHGCLREWARRERRR